MPGGPFDVLIGLRLSIVRRAADMLVLHFGAIRPHASGVGTVGDYAFHIQCPWRFDGPLGTITGRDDLWEYAGPGERPDDWSPEDGLSLQDRRFARFFDRDERTRSWVNEDDRFVVVDAEQSKHGDVRLKLANGFAILVFPASHRGEAWRLFKPESEGDHLVFPSEGADFAVSRRKAPRMPAWEVWLRLTEAPAGGGAIEAPPTVIMTAEGTRYRCGRCGRVLAIAEAGALKGFVIHCRGCDRYNQVPL
ncbi:MAG TPA: hypothetical protein VEK73_20900 [Xanthobacteraceae bacterium]|nr:hypothetical protein [Xanthobacteraceae bacterium]